MMDLLDVIFLAIIVERITEVITSSEIAGIVYKTKLKNAIYDTPPIDTYKRRILLFIDKLTSCGFCCSFWVSFTISFYRPGHFNDVVLDSFLVFGLSHLYHVSYELLRRGRINTVDINMKLNIEGSDEEQYDDKSGINSSDLKSED